jgi:hypothetical protein
MATDSKPKRRHPEHDEQAALFRFADSPLNQRGRPELKWLHSTLNGVRLPPGLAAKAKVTGNKKGVFDINLDVARNGFHGLKIEMKAPGGKHARKGTLSPEQKEWMDHYKREGYLAVVCHGASEAILAITKYLEEK